MKTIKVKIRSWESMEKEFGLTPNGKHIPTECWFTKGMKYMCNKKVKLIPNTLSKDLIVKGTTYAISKDMVKKKYRKRMER